MAEYKGIKGFKVQYLSADPSNPIIGQTWYNDTSKDLKYTEFAAAAWATGGSLSNARLLGFPSSAGTQTASFYAGGQTAPAPVAITEEYNGSTWTGGGNLPAAKEYGAGIGTLTAGLTASGSPGFGPSTATTEEYDGSSWTAGGSVNTARYATGGCGTQTAGLLFGGTSPPSLNATEEYDGNSWTTSPTSLNTVRSYLGGAGTQTAGLAIGGFSPSSPPYSAATEEYTGAGPATKTVTVS